MPTSVDCLLEGNLIATSVVAREARLSVKTVKNLREGGREPRTETKRAFLIGLNKLLEESGKDAVGPEIFDDLHGA